MIDWAKSLQVALIGFSGVFFGLILLQTCVNALAKIVHITEKILIKKNLKANLKDPNHKTKKGKK